MFSRNKFFAISLLIFPFVLSGCKESQKTQIEPESEVFTFFSSDMNEPKPFTDTIAREITKNTGVTLQFITPKGNPSDDISLMITNNNFPDLIFAKGDLSKLIEADALLPLDSFIASDSGKNIRKLYGSEIVKLRNSLEDPSIYTVGTYEIHPLIQEIAGTIQLQNAVLREFQYPKISTLDELESLLIAYTKRHPEINGHKTIGLSLITDSWYWYLGLSNPGNYLIGYPDDGQWIVDQKTMSATYKFLHPEMFRFYKWLNKIYHKGLLDPESFTQDLNVWKNKIENGYVLSTAYTYWGIVELQSALERNGFGDRTFAYLSITADKKFKDPTLTNYGFSGGWGIAISKQCKNPEKAFKFLDWMCSEEAQILVNWGIKDQDYYYDNYGRRVSILDSGNTGIGDWLYPFPEGGAGFVDSTGNSISKINKNDLIAKYTTAEKNTLAAYGLEMWQDLFPPKDELVVPKHGQVWQYSLSPSLTAKVNSVDEYVKQSLFMIITGPEDAFEKSWKNMQNHIKEMDIEEVENEITRLIQMKLKLWEN